MDMPMKPPGIIYGRGDVGLITSKGFEVILHVPGKRIEFIDPDSGNCFVAKLGIGSTELIPRSNSDKRFFDSDTPEIRAKKEFTQKYGMIIVPQYCLSFNKKDGLKSVAGEIPFTKLNWQQSYNIFETMKLPEGVKISMIAGFEVDQSIQHIIDTGEANEYEVTKKSKIFGGYDGEENVYQTGKEGIKCIDGVYNQTGLVQFWTQQMGTDNYRVIFAGCCFDFSDNLTLASKQINNPENNSKFWSSTGTLLFE